MNLLDLPGVRFRQVTFEPSASKHAGQTCGGVQLHVLDRETFQPVISGLHLMASCRALDPDRFAFLSHSWEGQPCQMDLLTGSPSIREQLTLEKPVDHLLAQWKPVKEQFATLRTPYLLYQ